MRWLIIILSTVLISLALHANSGVTTLDKANARIERCESVIKKCAIAYYNQRNQIVNYQMIQEVQSATIETLTKQVIDERVRNVVWYRRPEYLIPISLLFGVGLGLWANK